MVFAVLQFDRVHDREQGVAVLLDLGALVAVAGVLHRQFVETELVLHDGQFTRARIDQRNPDEAFRTMHVLMDLVRLDVGELAALLVRGAVGEHAWSPGFLSGGALPVAALDGAMIAIAAGAGSASAKIAVPAAEVHSDRWIHGSPASPLPP